MTFTGHIHDGTVVFDTPPPLANGTAVEVMVRETEPMPTETDEIPTHAELFKDIIGKAVGLPEDYALNHQHYRYVTPKR